MHYATHTSSRDEFAEHVGLVTLDPEPVLTGTDLMVALGHLDDLSEVVGHIPAEVVGLLVGVLTRRDAAAAQVARELRGMLA